METLGRVILLVSVLVLVTGQTGNADEINIEGVPNGDYTFIDGVGADFAQTFSGQSVNGTGITGTPTNPLTLQPSGTLQVIAWDGSQSILPQPDNSAPLSVLLDAPATSISWRMGVGDEGAVDIDFFAADGSLVTTVNQQLADEYAVYEFDIGSPFMGLTIYNNTDPFGLRYQNFVSESSCISLVTPPDGFAAATPPTLSWTAGAYDLYRVYAVFPYPGVGYGYPISFWSLGTSVAVTPPWFDAIVPEAPCYWAVLAVNTETEEWCITPARTFTKTDGGSSSSVADVVDVTE